MARLLRAPAVNPEPQPLGCAREPFRAAEALTPLPGGLGSRLCITETLLTFQHFSRSKSNFSPKFPYLMFPPCRGKPLLCHRCEDTRDAPGSAGRHTEALHSQFFRFSVLLWRSLIETSSIFLDFSHPPLKIIMKKKSNYFLELAGKNSIFFCNCRAELQIS